MPLQQYNNGYLYFQQVGNTDCLVHFQRKTQR